MVEKIKTYSFGECLFYDSYAYLKYFSEIDEVKQAYGQEILIDLEDFYGTKKYVFISERGLSTRLNPEILKSLNLTKMKALAIVSPEGPDRMEELIKEQEYFKGSFAFFTSFEAAKNWALTFLEED